MKPDRVLTSEALFRAPQLPRLAKVKGHSSVVESEGNRCLAVRTDAVVTLRAPRQDLSPNNALVLNLRLDRPFNGSLVVTMRCTTRAPGMSVNDSYFSVLHFNQPRAWRGRQRVLIPAVNLVATGFPDGWKNVESIELNFHGRRDAGTVLLGDVELLQVETPRGPRMSDEELLDALDLRRPDLREVARRAKGGRVDEAVAAFAAYLRKAPQPPAEPFRKYPHYRHSAADDICRHFILGQQLPPKIDWHVNPIGYLEWNHAFNRHHWLPALVEAMATRGQDGRRGDRDARATRYARELDSLLHSWIEQNPEPVGHNGGLDPAWETLSTSIRVNWAWGHVLRAARSHLEIRDRTLVDLAKMIHAHAEHLLAHWGHNNWYISESTAILSAAAYVPAFRRAGAWMDAGIQRLEREMRRQVRPDGAQFELSPGYHTMCADLFHLAWARAGFRGRRFSRAYQDRLWKMFDYLTGLTRPDGTYPVPNDAGCAMPKGNERLLHVGRSRRRQDWVWAGSGGAEGRPPRTGSVHFPDAGHVVLRSGWKRDDLWAFFDVAQYGASHQHEDKLQVELYAHGTTFLADPGISSYQPDPVVRHFRQSDSHNTVLIDGLGQWRGKSHDFARYEASSRGQNLWAAGRGLDVAQGRYDEPYGDPGSREHRPSQATGAGGPVLEGIVHTRSLVFVRPDYWLIMDRVAGRGVHEAAALWHFTPMHVRADSAAATVRTNRLSYPNLELICRGDWLDGAIEIVTGRETPPQGFIAEGAEIKPAPCAIVRRKMRLPLCGVTVAVPYATGSESHFRTETKALRGPRGTAGMLITVHRPGGVTDRFVWRHAGAGRLVADGIRSDALLSLVRTSADGTVRYASLAFGRSLRAGKLRVKGNPRGLAETAEGESVGQDT